MKQEYIKICGIIFPKTETNGVTIVDYPNYYHEYDPELANKITKEGQKQLRELVKKFNIKTKLDD